MQVVYIANYLTTNVFKLLSRLTHLIDNGQECSINSLITGFESICQLYQGNTILRYVLTHPAPARTNSIIRDFTSSNRTEISRITISHEQPVLHESVGVGVTGSKSTNIPPAGIHFSRFVVASNPNALMITDMLFIVYDYRESSGLQTLTSHEGMIKRHYISNYNKTRSQEFLHFLCTRQRRQHTNVPIRSNNGNESLVFRYTVYLIRVFFPRQSIGSHFSKLLHTEGNVGPLESRSQRMKEHKINCAFGELLYDLTARL